MPVTRHQQYNKETAKLLRDGKAKIQVVDSDGNVRGTDEDFAFIIKDDRQQETLEEIVSQLKLLNNFMAVFADQSDPPQEFT